MTSAAALTLLGQGLGESPQARQTVGAQLVQDARQHLGQLLGLGVAGDGEGVGGEGGLHFGVVEVDDRPLVREHVHLRRTERDESLGPTHDGFSWSKGTSNGSAHLFDTGDVVHAEFLQGQLEFLVIGGGCSVHDLLLSASTALEGGSQECI